MRHAMNARTHASGRPGQKTSQLETSPLHLPAHAAALPVFPVRISLDQHHSLKKQGRLHPGLPAHSRRGSSAAPSLAPSSVRISVSQKHRDHGTHIHPAL